MNPRTSIVIFADDLTGAAEIGAAARSRGLDTVIATGTAQARPHGDLVVRDTDSRLLQPADAARKIVSVAARYGIADAAHSGLLVLKKTDSVLRGPIIAELDTLSAISRHARILLVPGNPQLGRVIRDGHLYIAGEPIHRTAFARDPHHPAHSSAVTDLLGPLRRGTIHILKPGQPLPPSGLIVGEAASMEDVRYWASRVGADTLAAGSSVFLEALLEARGHTRRDATCTESAAGGVLVVSGTTADTTRSALPTSRPEGPAVFPMPESCVISAGPTATRSIDLWAAEILGALARDSRAVALPPPASLADPAAPSRIRAAFAAMIAQLHAVKAFEHLVIEGGSTAAMIIHQLKWNTLEVVAEIAPGVATLRPRDDRGFFVTLKPGSYPWPKGWWDELTAPRSPNS